MKKELQILEKHDLVKDEDSLKIEDLPARKAAQIYEELYSTVLAHQEQSLENYNHQPIDPFTFMASASMRADSTCSEFGCRLSKLDFLARYTALYANQVMIPLPLSRPEVVLANNWKLKYDLSKSALTLLRLRPLIEAGLVVPVLMRSFHCEHMVDWVEEMIEVVHGTAEHVALTESSDFKVTFQIPDKSPTGRPTLYIEGPEKYLEHGSFVVLFDESSKWRQKSWRFNRSGKVEVRGKKKAAALYQAIFNSIADDTSFYFAFARMHSSRYLSDRPGETLLLDAITQDEDIAANNKTFHDAMTHLLPLGDLPIATLLRIRREERDSFMRYRNAVQQLLANTLAIKKRIRKADVVDLYRESIEPELFRMRSELRQERRRQSRRVLGGIATLAATVSLGAFGTIVPVAAKIAASAAGAMVGGRLLSKAAEAQCEHGADLREKNDFYFLLRLSQEAGLE